MKPYLEKVAQPVTEDKTGQRLLSSATPHYKAMVKLLLENDAEKPNHSCQRFYIVYIVLINEGSRRADIHVLLKHHAVGQYIYKVTLLVLNCKLKFILIFRDYITPYD